MSVQCGGAPGLCRAVESVSVNFVFVVIVLFPLFFFFLFSFHVCTSDVLEVLGYYVYPSICIAGSNSEVNNSLYNGGKWSRTMSGYIALNAISFSVCRPHKALNVDTLHISCKQEKGQEVRGGWSQKGKFKDSGGPPQHCSSWRRCT